MLTHCKIRGYAIIQRQDDDSNLQMKIIIKICHKIDSYTTGGGGISDATPQVVCQSLDSPDGVTPYNTST